MEIAGKTIKELLILSKEDQALLACISDEEIINEDEIEVICVPYYSNSYGFEQTTSIQFASSIFLLLAAPLIVLVGFRRKQWKNKHYGRHTTCNKKE